MGFLRTSVTTNTIDYNTFFAPFGIFYVKTEIWYQIFQVRIFDIPLMRCFPFANLCFQMGVTIVGFTEHFGQSLFDRYLHWIHAWHEKISRYIGSCFMPTLMGHFSCQCSETIICQCTLSDDEKWHCCDPFLCLLHWFKRFRYQIRVGVHP